ncbi:hypothetical protein [Nitrogeniibacter aestuarii]|uniref:hypothetical protein n=1 Tax=Nitrogeniibacter aestuarii TaxID=2815343 RepID=UPI001E49D344|nr:hypothetical protein [Nitrogeniibacter aestuarii]
MLSHSLWAALDSFRPVVSSPRCSETESGLPEAAGRTVSRQRLLIKQIQALPEMVGSLSKLAG